MRAYATNCTEKPITCYHFIAGVSETPNRCYVCIFVVGVQNTVLVENGNLFADAIGLEKVKNY